MTLLSSISKNIMYYLHSVIVIAFMFGFGYLPPFAEGITQLGMQAIGIFLGLLWGWTFVDFIWPSLLSFIAVVLVAGTSTMAQVVSSGFGAQVCIQIVMLVAIAKYMENSGLIVWIAHWFLARKINIGRPWVFSFSMVLCSFVMSTLTQCVAAMVILWAIIYDISEQVGYKKGDKWVTFMVCGITVGGSFGAMAVPYQVCSVVWLAAMTAVTGLTVNFVKYTIICSLFSVIVILLYILVGKYLLRIDVSPLTTKEDKYAHFRGEKMTKKSIEAAAGLIIFVVCLFIPSILPTDIPFVAILQNLGVTGMCFLWICYIAIRHTADGEPLEDLGKLFTASTPWPIIILMAATSPVVGLLEHNDAGVIPTLVATVQPVITNMSPFFAVAVIVTVMLLATQFAHNLVLGLAFIPVFCPLLSNMGISPIVFTSALCCALQVSFFSPASSTHAAMCYANTVWTNKKDVYIDMAWAVLVGLIGVVSFAIPVMFVFL